MKEQKKKYPSRKRKSKISAYRKIVFPDCGDYGRSSFCTERSAFDRYADVRNLVKEIGANTSFRLFDVASK